MSESACARIRVRKLNLCMYVHSKHANTHCTNEIYKSSPVDRQNAYSMHTYAWMWQNAYDAKQCIHFAHTGTWLQSKSSPQKARTPRKRWHPGTLGIVRIDRISLHQPFAEYRHSLFRTTTTYISTLSRSLSFSFLRTVILERNMERSPSLRLKISRLFPAGSLGSKAFRMFSHSSACSSLLRFACLASSPATASVSETLDEVAC